MGPMWSPVARPIWVPYGVPYVTHIGMFAGKIFVNFKHHTKPDILPPVLYAAPVQGGDHV